MSFAIDQYLLSHPFRIALIFLLPFNLLYNYSLCTRTNQYLNTVFLIKCNQTYRMYGMLAGMWNLDAGSKSISDLKTGGLMPPYRSLNKWIWNNNVVWVGLDIFGWISSRRRDLTTSQVKKFGHLNEIFFGYE